MVNVMVLILWRYLKYLQSRTHISLTRSRLAEYNLYEVLYSVAKEYPMTNAIRSIIEGVGENCSPPPLVLLNNACGLGICSH